MSLFSEVGEGAGPERRGPLSDALSLWFAPRLLFASLRERPRSRFALFLVLVTITLATVLALDVLLDTMRSRGAEEIRMRGGGEEALQVLESPFARIGIVLLGPVSLFLLLLVSAAASYLLLMVTGGMEEERPFPALFRCVVWAKLVEVPRMLLWVPLVLAKGDAEVFFGPAALFPGETRGPLPRLLEAFDLFTIWYLYLFALGTVVVLRVSPRRAAAAVLVPWALWQIVKALGELI
jgi:hypothetical protein